MFSWGCEPADELLRRTVGRVGAVVHSFLFNLKALGTTN
jgi:hypothetical protein